MSRIMRLVVAGQVVRGKVVLAVAVGVGWIKRSKRSTGPSRRRAGSVQAAFVGGGYGDDKTDDDDDCEYYE